jgi:hypothetical protein
MTAFTRDVRYAVGNSQFIIHNSLFRIALAPGTCVAALRGWHFTIHNSPFIIQNCVCFFPQFPSHAPNAAPRMSYTPASPCAASTTSATTAIRPSNSKPPRWVNYRRPLRRRPTLIPRARPPLARAVGKLACLPSSIAKVRDTSVSLARRSWRSISRKFRLADSGFDRKILELPIDASFPRQRESTPGKMDPRFRGGDVAGQRVRPPGRDWDDVSL